MENNFNFENKDNFNLILINPSNIEDLSWNDIDYTNNLIKLKCYEIITYNSSNFADLIIQNLDLDKYNKEGLNIHTQVISESPSYIYELIYVDSLKDNDDEYNGIANLLNTNEDKIYGKALFLKTYIPSLSNSILIKDSNLEDIKFVLDNRIKTNIVCYDDVWSDKIVIGNLEDFAKDFFDGEEYKKLEMPFLLHNINIWYQIDDFSNKKNYICNKIIDKPIYKCLWFTMITDEYRGSIYLNEVEKILKLSNYIEFPYSPHKEWIQDEKDEYKRKIIKNKYKILDLAYKNLISK